MAQPHTDTTRNLWEKMEVARVIHAPPKSPPEAGIHESLDHLTLAETNIMSPPYTKPKRHTATTPTDTFSPTPSDPPQKKTRSRTAHTKVTQTQTTTLKKRNAPRTPT